MKSKLALVLVPDLRQAGGVANYFRVLRLDDIPGVDYFAVNRDGASSLLSKLANAVGIFASFVRRVRSYRLIHINPSLNRNSYYRDMVFVWLADRLGVATLVFFRGWDDGFEARLRGNRLQRLVFRRSYGRATAFIVLGEHFRQKLLALGVDPVKPIYVETTVASDEDAGNVDLTAKLPGSDEPVRMLFLSRVVRQKGIYIAIDAFAACKRALPDRPMSLHIAGSGFELAAVRQYVIDQGVADVVFEGDVSGPRRAELLRASHIMVYPTFYGEGLPNCVLEGMLFGLAIVARPVAAIPEVVLHGINGLLCDSLDARQFTDMLVTLVQDSKMLDRMAHANREVALRRFVPNVVRGRIETIYWRTASGACAG
jgi:glycosyltransferase involved in cell wall biosynthesis